MRCQNAPNKETALQTKIVTEAKTSQARHSELASASRPWRHTVKQVLSGMATVLQIFPTPKHPLKRLVSSPNGAKFCTDNCSRSFVRRGALSGAIVGQTKLFASDDGDSIARDWHAVACDIRSGLNTFESGMTDDERRIVRNAGS